MGMNVRDAQFVLVLGYFPRFSVRKDGFFIKIIKI